MIKVKSSNVDKIDFNKNLKVVTVLFKNKAKNKENENVVKYYHYHSVPSKTIDVLEDIIDTDESIGSWVHQNLIKPELTVTQEIIYGDYDLWKQAYSPYPAQKFNKKNDPNFVISNIHGIFIESHKLPSGIIDEYPRQMWTLIEEDGKEFISSGMHYVNVQGYLVTEKEFPGNAEIIVEM